MVLNKPNKRTVNILGQDWKILVEKTGEQFDCRNCEGYCDNSVKEIHIEILKDEPENQKDLTKVLSNTVRHEIIHAFMYESGLAQNSNGHSCWAQNEEMVDWWAIQFHKVQKVFEELEI